MVTNRTPINRPPRRMITPRAVKLFRQMLATENNHEEYCRLREELGTELKLKPTQYPAVIPPWQPNVSVPNSGGYFWHPHGQALYRRLAKLARIEV